MSDLEKANSTYSKARDIATGSDEAAMRRNAELNMTMDASVKAAQANFTKITASAGKLTFEPVIRNVLGLFNSIGKAGGGGDSGNDIGSKIGNGLLTGLGNVLNGPGIAALLIIGSKLTASFAQFSATAVGGLLGINTESRKMMATQEGVAALLRSNPTLMEAMLSPMTTRATKEEQFLAALGRETMATDKLLKLRLDLAAVAIGAGMSQSPLKSGWQGTMQTGPKTKTSKAGGHIPIEQVGGAAVAHEVSEAKKAGYSIAPSDVRAMRAKINGELSTVVYNKREKVIDNFMGTGEPAIIPPNKSLGQMMNSATGRFPLHAPGGLITHAANLKAAARPSKGRLTLPYGSAEYSIKGTQAKINHVLSPEEGKGNLGKIYDALFSTFRAKGVKKISGDLAANLRAVPRSDSSADKLTAMFPQISRARRAVMSEINVGGKIFRIKGKNYEEDLGMQAYDILKAVNVPGALEGVKMNSYLAAGQIPMGSRGIAAGAERRVTLPPSWISESLKKKPKTLKEKIAYKAAQAANWALTQGPAFGEAAFKLGDAMGLFAGGNMPIIHAAKGPAKKPLYRDSSGRFIKGPIQYPKPPRPDVRQYVPASMAPFGPLTESQQTIGEKISAKEMLKTAPAGIRANQMLQTATPTIPAAPIQLPKPPASFRPDIRMTRSGMPMNAVMQATDASRAYLAKQPGATLGASMTRSGMSMNAVIAATNAGSTYRPDVRKYLPAAPFGPLPEAQQNIGEKIRAKEI
jgi:hypothetical protein